MRARACLGVVALALAAGVGRAGEKAERLAPLPLSLPKPVFVGTPKHVPPGTTVDLAPRGKRPLPLVPPGTVNLARGRPVLASVRDPVIGELAQVTDGDREAADGSYVELGRGPQWIRIDLGRPCEVFAILLWHYHGDPRVYHDVVVQTGADPDFLRDARLVFNNDSDNSCGQGAGKDREYFETFEGKLLDLKGAKARFVRCWSRGSTADEMTRYTEVEVYGRPLP
ncbi:MAG: hypothetical protein AAB368_15195 [bacterium]